MKAAQNDRFVLLILLVILMAVGSVAAGCGRPSADLRAVNARVERFDASASKAEPVSELEHRKMYEGDGVGVDQSGYAHLDMGGCLLEVFRDTELRVEGLPSEGAPVCIVDFEHGTIFNRVQRQMIVNTEWAVITSLSTEFWVHLDADREILWIVVVDGIVQVEAAGQRVGVRTGEQTWVQRGQPPEPPRPATRAEVGDLFPGVEELTDNVLSDAAILVESVEARTPTPTRTPSPTPTSTPRPLVLEEWSVSPTEVIEGQSVTIKWRVRNAESVTLQPFGTVDSEGKRTDTPRQTKTYVLTATTEDGQTVQKSQEVVVIPPTPGAPRVKVFSVQPSELVKGQVETVRLTWDTEDADRVTIEPGLGLVGAAGRRDLPAPSMDTEYILVAANEGGETRAQAQVKVIIPGAPMVTSFTVQPSELVRGQVETVRLIWRTEGAESVTIEPGIGPVDPSGSRDVPAPSADTVYRVVAKNPGGETQREVRVELEEPLCTVAIDNLNLRFGPGTVYAPPIGALPRGTELKPLAFSPAGYPSGQWIQVQVQETGQTGWLSAQYVECNMDVTRLPAGEVPPTPSPTPWREPHIEIQCPEEIHEGQCGFIRWDIRNVREVYLDGSGVSGQGEKRVCPSSTTTYTWRIVRLDGRQAERTCTVTVIPPPPPCPLAPADVFAEAWIEARERIGCPTSRGYAIWSAEELFQRGYMFWREDTDRIYAIYDDHTWQDFADIWDEYEGDPEYSCPEVAPSWPPTSPPLPKRGFGKIWCMKSGVRDRLGWALDAEKGDNRWLQDFKRGVMIRSDDIGIAILYDDGTWQSF